MNTFTVAFFSTRNNSSNNEMQKLKNEDCLSDKSVDEETIPDEDFDKTKKRRSKLFSCPNVEQKGPNILCKNYELYHDCYYKDECCFAHGIEELRENIISPSYKTKMCKSFQENKFCNFGIRCSYRHNIK